MSKMRSRPDTEWQKASASNTDGTCVKMRRHEGAIEVGDTKQDPNGLVLRYSPAEIAAWIDGAKKGEFDHLCG